jgi:hypothetical protein
VEFDAVVTWTLMATSMSQLTYYFLLFETVWVLCLHKELVFGLRCGSGGNLGHCRYDTKLNEICTLIDYDETMVESCSYWLVRCNFSSMALNSTLCTDNAIISLTTSRLHSVNSIHPPITPSMQFPCNVNAHTFR